MVKTSKLLRLWKRIINKNEDWYGLCINKQSELKKYFLSQSADIMLMSSNIGAKETEEIENWSKENYPSVNLIYHYWGGGGLLKAELQCSILGIESIKKPALNCIL